MATNIGGRKSENMNENTMANSDNVAEINSQLREIINKEIERANKYYDQKLSKTQMAASIRVVSVLSEFLGDPFPYDRLHMGFATMD